MGIDLYDAAGSVLVVMLWVYYASVIFLFGASFTFSRAKLLYNEIGTQNEQDQPRDKQER